MLGEILANADPACRAAAYAVGELLPEQVLAAYERDKLLAVNEILLNQDVWMRPDARQALHGVCWHAARDDKLSDLITVNHFNSMKERMVEDHPDWFAEEEYAPEPDDKLATKADIAQAVDALAGQHGGTSMEQLRNAIDAANRRLGWVFWIAVGALVAGLRHW